MPKKYDRQAGSRVGIMGNRLPSDSSSSSHGSNRNSDSVAHFALATLPCAPVHYHVATIAIGLGSLCSGTEPFCADSGGPQA